MRELQAMSYNYMEEQKMAGSAGYLRRANELVDIIVTMHDKNDGQQRQLRCPHRSRG